MSFPPIDEFLPQPNYQSRAEEFFTFDQHTEDAFSTSKLSTLRQGSSKAAFGGLIFSQAVAAAERTVDTKFKIHAVHSFFLLNVDTEVPIEYRVRRVRDGRSFCTRTVEAFQKPDHIAFVLQASFNVEEEGTAFHQDVMPTVPHWSKCPSFGHSIPWIKEQLDSGKIKVVPAVERRIRSYDTQAHTSGDLFQMRPTDLGMYFGFGNGVEERSTRYFTWFRAHGDLNDVMNLHRYLILYNTDAWMSVSVFRPHVIRGYDPQMIFTLDHNVWIHNDGRADEWLLMETTSSIAGNNRGMSTGRVWREDGTLLMTCTQEIVLRSRGEESRL